jgi:hypothetical protein
MRRAADALQACRRDRRGSENCRDRALPPIGNRDRNRRLVDIHSHENGIVHQVRPSCLRLCIGPSDGNPPGPWQGHSDV